MDVDLADLPAEYDELFAAYDDIDTSDTDTNDIDTLLWPSHFSPPSSPASTLPSHASTPSFSSSTSSASFSTASLLVLDPTLRADSPLLGFPADATHDPLHFPCPGFVRDLAADKPPTARFRAASLSQQSPLPPRSLPTRRQSHLHLVCATPEDTPTRAARRAMYIDSEAIKTRLSELLDARTPSPEPDTRATPTQMYTSPSPSQVYLGPAEQSRWSLGSSVHIPFPVPPSSVDAPVPTLPTSAPPTPPQPKEAKQTRRKRLVSFIARLSSLPMAYDPPVPVPGVWSAPTSPQDASPHDFVPAPAPAPKQPKTKPPKPLKPKSKGKRRRLLVSGVPIGPGADAVHAVKRWAEGFGELREFRRVDPVPESPQSAPSSISRATTTHTSRRRGLFAALAPLTTSGPVLVSDATTEVAPVERGTTSLVIDWRDRAVSETVCRMRARVVIRGAGSVLLGWE